MKQTPIASLRRTLALLVLLLSGLSLQGQSTRYFDALRLYHGGKTDKAIEYLQAEIAADPANDAAHYYLGTALLSKQKPDMDRVEICFRKALELSPDNYWYKYALALFYTETGRPELSAPLLEELMAAHPGKSDLYFDAAGAYVSQGDLEKALEVIDKIEAVAGKNEMIALSKMDLIRKKDGRSVQGEKAAYDFLQQYYVDCRTPRLATMLGDFYQKTYRDSLAIARYDEAIAMDEAYSPAYYGRAHSYQSLRQYDHYFDDIRVFLRDPAVLPETKAEYLTHLLDHPPFVQTFMAEIDTMMLEACQAAPADTTLGSTLAMYYYRTDRQEQGIAEMRRVAESFPESYTLGFQHLLMLYYAKDWDALTPAADTMLARFPKGRDILILRASASRMHEDYAAAIADYERYAATAPRDSATIVTAYTSLGDLYYYQKNPKKAFACYEKVLGVAPDNLLALNNYAYFLSLEGKKLKKALKMSRKTIEQEPDNPTYLDTYAWILHLLGQNVEAKAIFKHAMLYGGKEEATILDHYAEVLYSLREFDLAYIYWNQARALDTKNELNIDEKVRQRKKNQ